MKNVKRNTPIAPLVAACIVIVATSAAHPAWSQATKAAEGPEVWRLNVRAQPVARPALEHGLLVKPVDQVPGNAAPQYLMAMAAARRVDVPPVDPAALAAKGLPPTDQGDMMYYYLGLPLDKLPMPDLEAFLKPYDQALSLLDSAARREHCDWGLPVREQGVATMMPHLNDARHLTNVASLRVRLHAARGEHADAVAGLRSIFQLGRHVGDDGLLVQALVGNGLAAVGVEGVKDLVQQPGAPNLYWPLANLPRPFMSLRESLEWESLLMLATLPSLEKVADGKPFTADDWRDLVTRQGAVARMSGWTKGGLASLDAPGGAAAAGALLYPQAKRYLLAAGMPADEVNDLRVPEALGRYVYGEYRVAFDELTKWAGLPYWQAQPGMARVERELFSPLASITRQAIAGGMPSAASRSALQFTRLDARVAALQTVEALRAYAAAHDGTFPSSLDELDAAGTPAPVNPFTGKPIEYQTHGTRASIHLPAMPADAARNGVRIELILVQ